jgi:hypothetical protein
MSYAVEMVLGVTIYTPSFIKFGSANQKLMGDIQTYKEHGGRISLY